MGWNFPGKVLHYSHVFDLDQQDKRKAILAVSKVAKGINETRQPKENQSNRARTFGLI